jgi:hypothetical protein
MANDSLIPYRSNTLETREESLTRQFYEWERRGRGWAVYDFPVELEPPFRPFYLIDVPNTSVVDDGRKLGFFASLIEELRGSPSSNALSVRKQQAEYESFLAETNEPFFCQYYNAEFTEHQLVLPQDLKVAKPVAEQLLLSCSYASHPIAFEIVGNSENMVVQFASSEGDSFQVKQQIKSHLPSSTIIETSEFLTNNWLAGGDYGVIADFGLSHEFMLPLNTSGSFETDPLVAVIGALSNLQDEEVGVLQVLFQKAKSGWAEEIMDSVRYFDGTPFFANAPEMIPLARQKVSRPLFAAIIRVAAKSYNSDRAWRIVRSLGAGLALLSNPVGNELIPLSNDGYDYNYHEQGLLDRQSFRSGMILNSEELVSLVHPPSANVKSERLLRESEKTKAVPPLATGNSLVLGVNSHQNEIREVSLKDEQRTKHIHVIGSSGSGKSTFLLNLIKQDLEAGQGLCLIDPHGDLIDEVVGNVPEHRIKDVILFDPSDSEFPIGFNILQAKSVLEKTLLSSDLIATFRRMSTSWGDVMDSVLANAILAFVESSRGGTLFDLKRFLVEKDFRNEFLETVEDGAIRYFWINEFPLLAGKPQSSILIRLDAFLRQRLIRNIVCQKENKLDFRRIMDNRKVLLIKLSQGLIGEENAYLLGTLLVSKLYQMALSRQDTQNRPFFWLYMDEFHHFITPSMERVLSGARKYNLGLVLAHQEFRQLQSRSQEVASSVLSNCYTRICFRLGDTDAEKFASGFSFFDAESLLNLGVGEAVARVERSEYDFNLKARPLRIVEKNLSEQRRSEIVRASRESYGAPISEVESVFPVVQQNQADSSETPEGKVKEAKEQKPKIKAPKQTPEAVSEVNNEHRYLQSIVKRIGESNGFVATLEKQVFGGIGKVDVALENQHYKVACEIAVTNTVEYEQQNVQKCLASGFDKVAVISLDTKHLQNIRKAAETVLTLEQLSKVYFLEPESFHLFLENISKEQLFDKPEKENKVKGYKIRTGFKDTSESGTRKQTVLEIIFGVLKRKDKK